MEEHIVDGKQKTLLVHRKGATRAFPPHHPLIPVDYQLIGQPVLIGGTMGTNSYVLTGTQAGFEGIITVVNFDFQNFRLFWNNLPRCRKSSIKIEIA